MNREFDKILKDKLGSFEEAPPPHIWENIAAAKPMLSPKIPFYKSISFKVAAVAASILLVVGLSLLNRNSDKIPQENIIKEKNTITYNQNTNSPNIVEAKSNSTIETNNTINTTNKAENSINEIDKLENTSLPKKVVATNNNSTSKTKIAEKPEKHNIQSKTSATNYTTIEKTTTNNKINSKASITKTALVIEDARNESHEPIETTSELIAVAELPTQQKSENSTNTETESVTNNTEKQNIVEENNQEALQEKSAEVVEIANNEEVVVPTEINADARIGKDFNPKTREFNKYGFGVHYGYEKLWINKASIDNHNIDLSFNYRNLSFILQTGIGAQFSNDNITYNVEYKRNDYLTTEMRFDSAQFILDSSGVAHIVPVNPYYEDIYDSVNHTYSNNFTETYYSLRLPLLVGYQKDFGKFGLTAKGGFIYSILISKQRTEVYAPDEASRVVMLQYNGSERVSAQIQYVLSAGIVYRLNKTLHLQFDFMGKYYQNSIYEASVYSKMNPWSAEARLGLVYFLN